MYVYVNTTGNDVCRTRFAAQQKKKEKRKELHNARFIRAPLTARYYRVGFGAFSLNVTGDKQCDHCARAARLTLTPVAQTFAQPAERNPIEHDFSFTRTKGHLRHARAHVRVTVAVYRRVRV